MTTKIISDNLLLRTVCHWIDWVHCLCVKTENTNNYIDLDRHLSWSLTLFSPHAFRTFGSQFRSRVSGKADWESRLTTSHTREWACTSRRGRPSRGQASTRPHWVAGSPGRDGQVIVFSVGRGGEVGTPDAQSHVVTLIVSSAVGVPQPILGSLSSGGCPFRRVSSFRRGSRNSTLHCSPEKSSSTRFDQRRWTTSPGPSVEIEFRRVADRLRSCRDVETGGPSASDVVGLEPIKSDSKLFLFSRVSFLLKNL